MIPPVLFFVVGSLFINHPPFELDREKKSVTRQDLTGKVIWSVTFKEEIAVPGPPLLWDKQRVYFSHKQGVTVLDAENGKTLWQAQGPEDSGLLLSDGLLLGTGTIEKMDHTFSLWLFAFDAAKGTLAFKTQLADLADTEELEIEQVGKLFLVHGKIAVIIDRKGEICYRLDRRVISAKQCGGDMIFLTGKNIVSVTSKDKVVWTIPFGGYEFSPGGELVELPGGDMIASQFGCIWDSGVSLIRFDPASGKEKWNVYCKRLGVGHSQYTHEAIMNVEGERLRVTSKGSFGTFVEILDLKTGRQLERNRK